MVMAWRDDDFAITNAMAKNVVVDSDAVDIDDVADLAVDDDDYDVTVLLL